MTSSALELGTALGPDPEVLMVVDRLGPAAPEQAASAAALAHWQHFAVQAAALAENRCGGQTLACTDDVLTLRLDHARSAVRVASELHRLAEQGNGARPQAEQLLLRVGVQHVPALADGGGPAPGLTARAGPGETVVSDTVHDDLTDGLDCALEDLGDGPAGPLLQALRVYRVSEADKLPQDHRIGEPADPLRPTLAVIPFAMRAGAPADHAIGELLADGLNVHLGCSGQLLVISRLSTTRFRERDSSPEQLRQRLEAAFALSGSYSRDGSRVHLQWELSDLRLCTAVASQRLTIAISDLLDPGSEALRAVASDVQVAILRVELQRVDRRPMPSLESFSLLLGGVMLLHRSTRRDFKRSFELLTHLIEVHPAAVEPRIWLAKWYALRAVQGQSVDRQADARLALDCTARALDREPDNSFALAMEGFVHCHLTQDFDLGHARVTQALRANPSETFAHLFRGLIRGVQGNWDGGLAALSAANSTSPLDPARYLFDTIGSYLYLGAGRHEDALALARRSLRANSQHAHTWRVMTIAQAETGDLPEAQQSLRRVLALQPDLTVEAYLGLRPDDPIRQRFAQALRLAGLPEH